MASFFYRAKDKNNKIVENYITASSVADAAIKLEQRGFIVLEIKEKDENFTQNSYEFSFDSIEKSTIFSLKEKKEFFNGLYFLYSSGLPINDCFKSMYNSTNNPNVKGLCKKILSKTNKGISLKEAIKDHHNALGIAYSSLIVAGEEAGELDEILSEILKNLKKEEEIKNEIISQITYPVIILFFAITVALFSNFFIIKVFEAMSEGNICVSSLLISAVIKILVIYVILTGIIVFIWKNKQLQKKFMTIISNLLFFKDIFENYCFTNFFLVMSLAYNAGVPITESLELSNSVINIGNIKNQFKKSVKMMKNGCELTTAMKVSSVLSSYAISQISAGEKAGELGKAFKAIAHDYENKFITRIKVTLKSLEPILIVGIGIFVGYTLIKAYKSYINGLFGMIS